MIENYKDGDVEDCRRRREKSSDKDLSYLSGAGEVKNRYGRGDGDEGFQNGSSLMKVYNGTEQVLDTDRAGERWHRSAHPCNFKIKQFFGQNRLNSLAVREDIWRIGCSASRDFFWYNQVCGYIRVLRNEGNLTDLVDEMKP